MTRVLILSLLLFSCGQSPTNKETVSDKSFEISKAIPQVIEHYNEEYKGIGKMTQEKTDTAVEITYYNIPSKEDSSNNFLLTAYISTVKNDYVFGDLDNDGIDEVVLSVNTEGGGGGGNVWWNDIFLFKKVSDSFKLITSIESPKICGCESGNFYPKTIQNGSLLGTSSCWDKNDAHCCPSLEYESTIKLKQTQFVFQDKKKINSGAQK